MGAFFKSFWREMGRNTGKRVSNAVYGDKWSTPYRARITRGEDTSGKKGKKSKKSEYVDSGAGSPRGRASAGSASYDDASLRRIMKMAQDNAAAEMRFDKEHERSNEQKRREAEKRVMEISHLEIPRTERALVDMMGQMLTLVESLDNYGTDAKVKKACWAKFQECNDYLLREFPRSNHIWRFYFINFRHFISKNGCLAECVIGMTVMVLFTIFIGLRNDPETIRFGIFLVALTVGVPLLCILWQFIRILYFRSCKRR